MVSTWGKGLGLGAVLAVLFGLAVAGCGKGLVPSTDGACKQGYASNGSECARVCVSDFDCRDEPGMRCELNLCQVPTGGECTKAADCLTPGPCKMAERTRCEGALCVYVDCAAGYDCVDRACALRSGIGEACQSSAGCKAGLKCGAGVCCDAAGGGCCKSNSDCTHNLACNTTTSSCEVTCRDGESVDCADPTKQVCMGGACVAKSNPGQACSADAECGSGFCAPGATGRVCCDKPCDGLCEMCGDNGVCDQAPPDDPGCSVSCGAFNTACRVYPDVTANRCESHGKCKTPTAAVCGVYVDQPTSTVCRPAAGPCDAADYCDGRGSCGADLRRSAGEVCRAAAKGADGASCDTAEVCDGTSITCPADKFAVAGTTCRAAVTSGDGKSCDVAETCSGTSALCPADVVVAAGTVCRAKLGECDVEETCGGKSGACPADAKAATTQVCRASGGVCDVAETCDGVGDTCPADAKAPASKVCRPAVMGADGTTCDAAETCNGAGNDCPADAFAAAATVCRAAVKGADGATCDAAETCSGTSVVCPADAFATAATVCRAPAGACDAAETCGGTTKVCPADVKVAKGVVCRGAVSSECDTAEACDGTGDQCPADVAAAEGTTCGGAPAGACDLQNSCDGHGACVERLKTGDLCHTGVGECDSNAYCSGGSKDCPSGFLPASTTCGGTPAGGCDAQDTCDGMGSCVDRVKTWDVVCHPGVNACNRQTWCDGTSKVCPSGIVPANVFCAASTGGCDDYDLCDGAGNCIDRVMPSTEKCHTKVGLCDADRYCSGTGKTCPAPFVPAGTTCGNAPSGACDAQDTCDNAGNCLDRMKAGDVCHVDNGSGCDSTKTCNGTDKTCPASFLPANTTCGPTPAGACDVQDSCDGAGKCVDRVRTNGDLCRGAAGFCDIPEYCDGTTKSCPSDYFVPDTVSCGTVCSPAHCAGTSAACIATTPPVNGTSCGDCRSCQSGSCKALTGTPCWGSTGLCGLCSAGACEDISCGSGTKCCLSGSVPECLSGPCN